MKTERMTVKIEFTEPILGSSSANPEVHSEYIASKAPDTERAEEEVAAVKRATKSQPEDADPDSEKDSPWDTEEEITKSMTVFPRDLDGRIHIWDYQIKGYLKEALFALIELGHDDVKGMSKWTYLRTVNQFVWIEPRVIHLLDPAGNPWGHVSAIKQRPLRAKTARGERICLASSEQLPMGTSCQFEIEVQSYEGPAKKSTTAVLTMAGIEAALDRGEKQGFAQWRSGGFGRFTWAQIG